MTYEVGQVYTIKLNSGEELVAKVIEILKHDMNSEDAWEHFAFNIAGSYVGEKTPIWCYDLFE